MPEIEIYTSPFCGYCHRAKTLLERKGVSFTEHDVMMSATARREMTERAGGVRSVPQIFVDGKHIGDSDGIHAMDARGELDAALGIGG
ncbi:MAG: glutaredoxin 3 [Proteobacteria bacterium]|nr:glutaredoxin 3 [Pseudomonadota bacterium]